MALENINLNKVVVSNEASDKSYLKKFSKLAKSQNKITFDNLLQMYNKLFYLITKLGSKNTHEYIINQIFEALPFGQKIIRENEVKIKNLIDNIALLEDEYLKLTAPKLNEHPIYPDRTYLTLGENGIPYQGENRVWIMQEGVKRLIKGGNTGDAAYLVSRKLLNLPEDNSGWTYLTEEELENILTGPAIRTHSDLDLTGFTGILEDLKVKQPYYKLKLYCQGSEVIDTYDIFTGPGYNFDTGAQVFLSDEGCQIWYVHNPYYDEVEEYTVFTDDQIMTAYENGTLQELADSNAYEIKTLNLEKGDVEILTFARNASSDVGSADSNIIGYNAVPDEIYDITNFNNVTGNLNLDPNLYMNPQGDSIITNEDIAANKIALWGKDNLFSGLVIVSGRVMYKELEPTDESNSSWKILNGLNDIYTIEQQTPTLDEITVRGTRRIYSPALRDGILNFTYPISQEIYSQVVADGGVYGAINQSPDFQRKFLDNTTSHYYAETINIHGNPFHEGKYPEKYDIQGLGKGVFRVYGQPVFYVRHIGYFVIICVEGQYKQTQFDQDYFDTKKVWYFNLSAAAGDGGTWIGYTNVGELRRVGDGGFGFDLKQRGPIGYYNDDDEGFILKRITWIQDVIQPDYSDQFQDANNWSVGNGVGGLVFAGLKGAPVYGCNTENFYSNQAGLEDQDRFYRCINPDNPFNPKNGGSNFNDNYLTSNYPNNLQLHIP